VATAMRPFNVAVIPGDGIGKEVIFQTNIVR
jgi:isocitrate/isopropylmalate dehydrogenase